jgi:hypothetical protein
MSELFDRLKQDPDIKEKALESKLMVSFVYSNPRMFAGDKILAGTLRDSITSTELLLVTPENVDLRDKRW